ncbi:MAG: hypothetical protein ABI569_16690 [Casimicrobiaceae bacterium]
MRADRNRQVRRLATAAFLGCVGVALAWLVVSDSSPLSLGKIDSEVPMVGFNFVAEIGLPAIIVSAMVTGNWHDYYGPVFFAAFFIELFAFAYLALTILGWWSRRHAFRSTRDA